MSHFSNAYADPDRAASYSALRFPGTYALAFRDLPALFEEHGVGAGGETSGRTGGQTGEERDGGERTRTDQAATRRALDFGCGAGRSTRFLRDLGYDVVGVDISEAMLVRARELDAEPGVADRYLLIDDDPAALPAGPFELVLAAYPFDNIPDVDHRVALLSGLRERLSGAGRLVLLASSPDLYVHEWVTFTTAAFPENAAAGSGDPVRIVIKDGGDPRPVDDQRWFDYDYRAAFAAAGLEVLAVHRPLATGGEDVDWISETEIPPWVIYVTGAAAGSSSRM
jgi:SAM-dependent methyltransferase